MHPNSFYIKLKTHTHKTEKKKTLKNTIMQLIIKKSKGERQTFGNVIISG